MNTTAVHIDTQLYNSAAEYARRQHTSVDRMVENFFVSILKIPTTAKRTEKESITYQELLTRLDEMAALKADEGALPIDKTIINTVRKLIERNGGQALDNWIIFPDTNGTLQLDAKERDAVISIGRTEYSYFYNGKEGSERASHVDLTIDSLAQLINHINE